MQRTVDLLYVCESTKVYSLAVSKTNSCIYFTCNFGVQIVSQSAQHIQTFYQGLDGELCAGICIYDCLVYIGCVDNSGIGSIKIFNLNGYFITSLREFKIKHRIISIKEPLSLLVDEADNELGIFLCDSLYNIVYCSTGKQSYSLPHIKPSEVKSDRFVLFVMSQSDSSIVMVDKFDICTTLCVIHPGIGNNIRSRIRTSYAINPINSIAIHPIREEIYIFRFNDGLLQVYNWEGYLIESVYSDYLFGKSNGKHALTTDVYGYVFILVDSSIVRIDMSRDRIHD